MTTPRERGLTLVQLLVALSVASVVGAGGLSFFTSHQASFRAHQTAIGSGLALDEAVIAIAKDGGAVIRASLERSENSRFKNCLQSGACTAEMTSSEGVPAALFDVGGTPLAGVPTARLLLDAEGRKLPCAGVLVPTRACPLEIVGRLSMVGGAEVVAHIEMRRLLEDRHLLNPPRRMGDRKSVRVLVSSIQASAGMQCPAGTTLVGRKADGTLDCKARSVSGFIATGSCGTGWATSSFNGTVSPSATTSCACGAGTTHMFLSARRFYDEASAANGMGNVSCYVSAQGGAAVRGHAAADAHDGANGFYGAPPRLHVSCDFVCFRYQPGP